MLEILTKLPERFLENQEYAYAVGRIRALEVSLIDKQRFERLLKAGVEEMGRILVDTDYSHSLSELLNPSTFENALQNEKQRILGLIDSLVFEEDVREFLHLEFDYFNARVLLKGKIFDRDVSDFLVPFGNLDIDDMKQVFDSEEYEKLPKNIVKAIQNAISSYYHYKEPRMIDFTFDRAFIEHMNMSGYPPFLQDYYRLLTDLTNFRSLLRWKVMELDRSRFRDVLLPGGFIPEGIFLDLIGEPVEQIPGVFSRWIYYPVFLEGTKYLNTNHSFIRYEAMVEKLLSTYIDKTRYLVFGVEPVIAYYLRKMKEIKNMRIILVGKFNGVEEEILAERLVI